MDIYHEGNLENAAYFYPDVVDRDEAFRKVENDFLGYIKNEFLDDRNQYMVLEYEGLWVSALRLHWVKEQFYYIQA
ncbi:MAG: hypothetical protein K2N82_02240, partial [Lachnospiraceae bacterium]|nr:hypothetical protein [Lachnospiraceae bacterium]